MNIILTPEQVEIATRCIDAFYLGLKWADKFGICGGYAGNRNFHRVFRIDDNDILGVFDNRNLALETSELRDGNPCSLHELINLYKKRQCNIKTLVVLEKENYRLASSESQGRQSKFLIDALYPALEGIRAKYSRNYDCHRWRKLVSAAVRQDDYRQLSIDSTSLECWLSGIYHNPEKTNELLLEKSPLRYFYKLKSPLNH